MYMKNIKFIAIAMGALLLLAGCNREEPEILQGEPDFASVKLSSTSTAIDVDGGEKVIFFATNRVEVEALCEANWIDVSVENNSLTLFVDPNEEAESRLAVVDVVVGHEPDVAKARLKVVQQGNSTTNLSATEKANCYVAQTERSYYFSAAVKGNGKRDGHSRYFITEGFDIEGAAYADLAWEATYDGDKTRSTKIIEGTPIYSAEEEAIYFSTGESEGNALITIHNAEGDILWSWHIWVTNKPIKTNSANGLEWMDRNLGALTNEVGDIANRGMLYQWGRKEPFLPSPKEYVAVPKHTYDENYNLLETEEEYLAIQEAIEAAREQVNHNNMQTGDGFLEWEYLGVAPVAMQAPGNLEYAVQNPTTFLGCRVDIPIGEYVFDWYLQKDLYGVEGLLQQSQSMLWGDAEVGGDYKTIFDPCPPGYAVPPRSSFDSLEGGYACTYVSRDWEAAEGGWIWKGGTGDYFPSSGNFDVSGLIGETGEKMLYWSAESFGSGAQGFGKSATLFVAYNDVYYGIYPLLDVAEAASWYSYGARCYGAAVRCVRSK